MKRLSLLLVMLCISGVAWSQVRVTGKVTDQLNGEGLPGVNILVKGTTNGAVTDIDGNYSINVAPDATLVFSYVGYVKEEVPVNNRSTIDLNLAPDIEQLSEVVVVGYGQQEKEDVTGSVVEVDSKEFNKGAIVSPDQLINGKVPGVNITPDSGEPGGKVQIRIRGGTSLTAGNDPLYVIDGVPLENTTQNGGRNPLNFLNPNDIESFTVLKDASAAAIYGSRAANGVIIITTKSGKAGAKPRLNYDSWVSFSNAVDKIDVLNGDQYRLVAAEVAPDRTNLLLNANTDWQSQVLRTAVGQNHSLSFTGGGENTGYRISFNYLDKEGIIETSSTKRTGLNLNLNQSLFDNTLDISLGLKGAYTEDAFVDGAAISNSIGFAPTQPIYDVNSQFGGYWEWPTTFGTAVGLNPVSVLDQTEFVGETYRSLGNMTISYDLPFISGLSAKVNLAYDVLKGQRSDFQPFTLRSQSADSGQVKIESITRTMKLLESYLNYEKNLKGINSNIKALAGYSYQDFFNGFPTITARRLSTNIFGIYNPTIAGEYEAPYSVQENRLISFFGRVDYDFMSRYLLTVNARYDGSSRFGDENRWGFFPSASLGWRIIEEPWMDGLSSIFNDLKVRAGWGITGNQEFANYQYFAVYRPSDQFTQYPLGGEPITTIRPSAYNPQLKWEETTQYNVGLDYSLLNGRLNGTLDFYLKQTDDLLFNTPVPAGTNLSNFVVTNIGSMENKGVELGLNGIIIDKSDIRWDLGFNVAYNHNEITKLNGNTDPDFRGVPVGDISGGVGNRIQILSVGESRNTFYVFEHIRDENGNPLVDGVDHNDDGVVDDSDLYVDQNEDGIVNDSDRIYYNDPLPDWLFGLTSNVNAYNFDLSFTLRGSLGGYVYNNFASFAGNYSRLTNDITPGNMHASVLDNQFEEPQLFSDIYVEDASFLRMDNITLGYTVPNLGENVSLRVYGTVQNAFVITDYSGIDPESGIGGIDNDLYPRSRTFLIGLNLGL
ncbi:SusC/RagA family TonB-linked outer membrane protein [Roseivirga sp. BDSF3-8]|uniref:SusC/RagA family TonB-linked outer membrane protein n=1 Tax=Roseivirga sp. BDSF3-8 TaxID=3241598 RepID=UPI003531D516